MFYGNLTFFLDFPMFKRDEMFFYLFLDLVMLLAFLLSNLLSSSELSPELEELEVELDPWNAALLNEKLNLTGDKIPICIIFIKRIS